MKDTKRLSPTKERIILTLRMMTHTAERYLDRRQIFSKYVSHRTTCSNFLSSSSIGNEGEEYENKNVSFHYFYLALEELTLLGFLLKRKLNFKTVGYKLNAKGVKRAEDLGLK